MNARAQSASNRGIATLSDIANQRAAINQQTAALDQQEAALREQTANTVKATFDGLPQTLGAILGRKLTLSEAVGMAVDHVKGKLSLSGAATRKAGGAARTATRQYRTPLSEQEKANLKQVLTIRQAVIDGGGSPGQTISEISKQFKTTDATVNKWKAAWGLTRTVGSRA